MKFVIWWKYKPACDFRNYSFLSVSRVNIINMLKWNWTWATTKFSRVGVHKPMHTIQHSTLQQLVYLFSWRFDFVVMSVLPLYRLWSCSCHPSMVAQLNRIKKDVVWFSCSKRMHHHAKRKCSCFSFLYISVPSMQVIFIWIMST